jgi:uncharacterized protein (DUF1501 family)
MNSYTKRDQPNSRRDFLRGALGGMSLGMARRLGLPLLFSQAALASAAEDRNPKRILVIFELSGGNDGLNTVVPYADDAYYRHRPHIGIKPTTLRKIDDRFGFSPGMAGFERLYKAGRLAIVHGCGYENPSFSHFTSMAYWHTAAPNSGEEYGWVGRLADAMQPDPTPNYIVNVDATQSLAVSSRLHTPVVFDDLNFTSRPYDPWLAYGQSKTANVLFAVEATRRWGGDGITANAVHPGAIADTNLSRHMDPDVLAGLRASGAYTYKTIEQGAATLALIANKWRQLARVDIHSLGDRRIHSLGEAYL